MNIDADEEVTPETQKNLLDFLTKKNHLLPQVFNFKFIEPQPDNNSFVLSYYKNTIFSNRHGIHFKYRVHEKLFSDKQKIISTDCPFLTINHYGNLKNQDNRVEKLGKYKKMLLKELQSDYSETEKAYHYFNLGTTLFLMAEMTSAIANYQKGEEIYQKSEKKDLLYFNLLRNFSLALIGAENYDLAWEKIKIILDYFPDFIDARFYLAYIYKQKRLFGEAIEIFKHLLKNFSTETPSIFPSGLISYNFSLIPEVYAELLSCYLLTDCLAEINYFLADLPQKIKESTRIKKLIKLYFIIKEDLSSALALDYQLENPGITTKIADSNIICLGSEHNRYRERLILLLQKMLIENDFSKVEKDLIRKKIKKFAPKLSVCMIVKNEEEFIEKSLRSFLDLVHELIVMDTGSTDSTIELVRKTASDFPETGLKIYQTIWEDDYAKARNNCADKASGDWILRIDGDEKLTDRTRNLLLPFLASQNPSLALAFNFKIIEPRIREGETLYNTYYKNILYRNKFAIRFVKKRHEFLESREFNLITKEHNFLELFHYANLKKNVANKSEVNIEKMLEIANNSEDLKEKYFYFYFIANSYHLLGDYEQSILYYKKALELTRIEGDLNYEVYILRNLTITLIFDKKDYYSVENHIKRLFELCGQHPDLYFYAGYSLQNRGEIAEARKKYLQALKIIAETPENSERFFCDLADLSLRIKKELEKISYH